MQIQAVHVGSYTTKTAKKSSQPMPTGIPNTTALTVTTAYGINSRMREANPAAARHTSLLW
jgi:hypothetical protein